MQQPLPPASRATNIPPPNPPPAAAAQPDPAPAVPDITRPYRGWYPRWWLLSAFCCGVLIGILELTNKFICTGSTEQTTFCQLHIDTWTDPVRQTLVVLAIWLLFLTGWLVAHLLGVGTIEIYRYQRGPLANIFASLSEFGPIYILMLIYGALAFCYIVVIWGLGQYFNAFAFSLASIIIFVALSCFLYRQTSTQRRTFMLGCALIGVWCIGAMFLFKRIQPTILIAEIIAVIFCSVLFFRRRPPDNSAQSTPEDRLAYAQSNAITPAGVFTALISSWQRNRQATGNNVNPAMQPTQAAPNPATQPTQPARTQPLP